MSITDLRFKTRKIVSIFTYPFRMVYFKYKSRGLSETDKELLLMDLLWQHEWEYTFKLKIVQSFRHTAKSPNSGREMRWENPDFRPDIKNREDFDKHVNKKTELRTGLTIQIGIDE